MFFISYLSREVLISLWQLDRCCGELNIKLKTSEAVGYRSK